jgi:hypothetical protein
MPDLVHEAGRAIEMEFLVPAQKKPDQMVESDKMVNVGVRNEYMAQPEEFPGGEVGDLSQVKKYRPSFEEEIDKEPRVPEGAVDKAWMKQRSHALSHVLTFSCGCPCIQSVFK